MTKKTQGRLVEKEDGPERGINGRSISMRRFPQYPSIPYFLPKSKHNTNKQTNKQHNEKNQSMGRG